MMSFDESVIAPQGMDKDSFMRLRILELEHNKEKAQMMNRLNILEEKYAMVLESLSTMDKRNSVLDEGRMISQINFLEETPGRPEERYYTPAKNRGNDEFYALNAEINRGREEVVKAEVEYIMFKRLNFPEEFRTKKP